MKLKPVGTEFEIDYPPVEYSTNIEWITIRYRVTGHKRPARFLGDTTGGELAEVIEAIGSHSGKRTMRM